MDNLYDIFKSEHTNCNDKESGRNHNIAKPNIFQCGNAQVLYEGTV